MSGIRRRRVLAVGGLAPGAGLPAGEPVDEDLGGHLEGDHVMDLPPALRQHLVQRFGLRHGAREAVEQEALLRDRARQRLVDDAVDDVVGHQLPRVHQRLRLPAQRGSVGHRLAQDVAGGKLRKSEARDQALRLRALACSRRPEEDEVHGLAPLAVDPQCGAFGALSTGFICPLRRWRRSGPWPCRCARGCADRAVP